MRENIVSLPVHDCFTSVREIDRYSLSTFTARTYVALIEMRDRSYIAKCPAGAIRHFLCQQIIPPNVSQLFLYKTFRMNVCYTWN